MMKRHFSYIAVFCSILILGVFSGCNISEVNADEASSDSSIRVVGRVTPFHNIDTKSVKSNQESKITNMAMLVVDGNKAIVETQFVEDSKPLFIIDRSSANSPYSDDVRFEKSRIYIIANIPYSSSNQSENKFIKKEGNSFFFLKSDGSHIGSIDDFLATDYIVQEVGQPSLGFPMYGVSDELNLKTSSPLSGEVLEIPLSCLYSKVVFNLSVAPIQTVDGVKQRFTLTDWTVHNVPSKLRVQAPAATDPTVNSTGTMLDDATFTRTDNGLRYAEQNGKAMTFSFYMPEHKINPGAKEGYAYPSGISDDEKQRFKPKLISEGQKPTYVTIHGIYTDHNSHDHEVSYDVYLGENNRDNFYINRDCQLNNNVYIKGITNSDDGTGVSLDWRVNVTPEPFTFSLERETLLDSHWEIRPIRISFNSAPTTAKIQVEILNSAASNWIRMEKPSNPAGADYCCSVSSTDLAYGKRKYFTTDLVSNTLQANTRIELSAADGLEQTVWVYVDENTEMPETDGSTVRSATVQCRYYENGYSDADNPGTATVSEDFTFRQRSLHRITYGERHYGIEYFEEYLYNFDSKDNYDVTTDGMAWGLDGVDISSIDKLNPSFVFSGSSLDFINDIVNNGIGSAKPYYDFYITSAESQGTAYSPYSGLHFTKQIVESNNITKIPTNEAPRSAVEYCLNKNKRNPETGLVDRGSMRWFLPAIDQIEEICKGGYSDFNVFQDKFYWSSQPAYSVFDWTYTWLFIPRSGTFYQDNTHYARATKVDNSYETVTSGQENADLEYDFNNKPPTTSSTGKTIKNGLGYKERTDICRVRCVYSNTSTHFLIADFEGSISGWNTSNLSATSGGVTAYSGSGYGTTTQGKGDSYRTSYIVTPNKIAEPCMVSWSISRPSNNDDGDWILEVSSDGTNWTSVKQVESASMDQGVWIQYKASLRQYKNVYVRLRHYSESKYIIIIQTNPTYYSHFIDNIVLEYELAD